MSITDLCYATYRLATQTVEPNLPSFQGIKRCVQYLASHPHKTNANVLNAKTEKQLKFTTSFKN